MFVTFQVHLVHPTTAHVLKLVLPALSSDAVLVTTILCFTSMQNTQIMKL